MTVRCLSVRPSVCGIFVHRGSYILLKTVVGYWRNRSGILCVPLADTYTVAGAYHTPQQKLRPGGRVLLSGDSLCTYQQLERIRPAAEWKVCTPLLPTLSPARYRPLQAPKSKMHFFSFLSNKERKETSRCLFVLLYMRASSPVRPATVKKLCCCTSGKQMGALPYSTEIRAPVSLRTPAYRPPYARSTPVPLERLLGGADGLPSHLT